MKENKPKRQKHNYTSELELKSLLIRIKNKRAGNEDQSLNNRINKYIKLHTALNNKKYKVPAKKNITKNKLKEKVVELSEKCCVDTPSYEQFGKIILLMIKNILKKPQFSGYTYRDDFYSDSIHKILKYLGNFNHLMISERTQQPVNSFAYISQIMHNSILYIINTKKKENANLRKHVGMQDVGHDYRIKNNEMLNASSYFEEDHETKVTQIIELDQIKDTLVEELEKITSEDGFKRKMVVVKYPKDYLISFEEYDLIKPYLKGNLSILKVRDASDN